MSSFISYARRLDENEFQQVMCLDDYFGSHRYGVKFADGEVLADHEVLFQNRNIIDPLSEHAAVEAQTIDDVYCIVMYDNYLESMMHSSNITILRFDDESDRDRVLQCLKK